MNYKVQGTIRRNKRNMIIFLILWVILSIVFVMPIAYAIKEANLQTGAFNMKIFLEQIYFAMNHFGTVIGKTLTATYIGEFFSVLLKFSVLYAIFILIGLIRTAPKNEFSDIEHGSSDWSKNGEQYRVLSNKKGIILAQNNYLPVDKRGNVNVLVVGRFWFW